MRCELARRSGRHAGLTLIELMVVVAVLAIVVSIAVPSFVDQIRTRRLAGHSELYLSHLNWARLSAVSRRQSIYIRFGQDAHSSCYVFYAGTGACTCSGAGAVCTGGAEKLLGVALDAGDGVQVRKTGADVKITVDDLRGYFTPTMTVVFRADDGSEIRQITNLMGRTRTCKVGQAGGGWPDC